MPKQVETIYTLGMKSFNNAKIEISREFVDIMCVVGLPVARYVYSFGTGEASGHWRNWLAQRPDKAKVSGSIPECPTTNVNFVYVRITTQNDVVDTVEKTTALC